MDGKGGEGKEGKGRGEEGREEGESTLMLFLVHAASTMWPGYLSPLDSHVGP